MDLNFFVSLLVILLCISPTIGLVYVYKESAPRYHGIFLFGVIFILWAAFSLGILKALIVDPDKVEMFFGGRFSPQINKINANLDMWVYIFPAVNAAIGVNLISEFLLRNKTDKLKKLEF